MVPLDHDGGVALGEHVEDRDLVGRGAAPERHEALEGAREIALGGSVVTDTPQSPDNAGSIKYAVPLSARQMVDFGTPGAGA